MATRQRPVDVGTAHARSIIDRAGRELRTARRDRDLSMRMVGSAVGLSESQVSRIERGLVDRVSVFDLARLHAVVGLDLTVRSYPGGSPIRDAAQVGLITDLCDLLPTSLGWSTEVPMPQRGDQRAWDLVIRGDAWRTGVEAETGPHDGQALTRRILAKQRDSDMPSVILLLRATAQTRRFLEQAGELLRSNFPVDGSEALARLRTGQDPGGNAVIVLPPTRRSRTRTCLHRK